MEYWPVCKTIAMRRFLETDDAFSGWHYPLRGIALDTPVLEKIYYKNYLRYVTPQPKPLDVDGIIGECDRILQKASQYAIMHDVLPEMALFVKKMKPYLKA